MFLLPLLSFTDYGIVLILNKKKIYIQEKIV